MAGGLPMGATLIGSRLGQLPAQVHGSTFGGNPLGCAASLAAIDFIEEQQLAGRAAELGAWFIDQLQRIESPLIREVRGLGLMVGIALKQKVTPYLQELMKHGSPGAARRPDDDALPAAAGSGAERFGKGGCSGARGAEP